MTAEDMRTFFEPRGVAIVGARRNLGFGYGIPIMLKAQGWADHLWLVNPSVDELHDLPVYKTVAEVPDPVDLAVLLVPAPLVPRMLDEVGKRGIRHAIIESAGFAEIGDEGRKLQDDAEEVARRHGIRVIGPNCVGLINTSNKFSTVEIIEEALIPGSSSIIAQSGVFGNCLLDLLHEYKLFVAKAVTLGDRMDVNECDMLEYLRDDPDTKAIMMYLEGAADGARLRSTLQEVTRTKPVLVLKSGRTPAGSAATSSHTGSLSGEDILYDAVFTQTGTIRAANLEGLVEMTRMLSTQPPPKGNRLGIVTSSGSLGVMATDTAVNYGLEVPPLSENVSEKIRGDAPGWMNVKNPLDVGPSGMFATALEAMLLDPDIDMVLAITIIPYVIFRELEQMGFDGSGWFGKIADLKKAAPHKPLAVCPMGHSGFISHMSRIAGPDVPVYLSPEPAARALAAHYHYWTWRNGSGRTAFRQCY
jgi:acyl-CoA synthetase (NDP forming)